MSVDQRHYRTRRARFVIYPFTGLAVLLGLLLVLVPRGGPVIHLGVAVCVVLAIWIARNGSRMGLEVSRSRVVVYGPLGSKCVEWDDVVEVDTHRWSYNEVVDLRLGRRARREHKSYPRCAGYLAGGNDQGYPLHTPIRAGLARRSKVITALDAEIINMSSKVVIVLSNEFASRLEELARSSHVWAVQTPETEGVARQIWEKYPPAGAGLSSSGMTLFTGTGDARG